MPRAVGQDHYYRQPGRIKVGYEERRAGRKYEPGPLTEVEIDRQRLALLVPTNKMEQVREPGELLKDDATGHDLKESFGKAGLEEIEGVKDEAPDELIKDVAADNTTGNDTQGVAKEMVRDNKSQEDVIAYDANGHDLGKPNRTEFAMVGGDKPEERPSEAAAQEVVALNVPCGRSQKPKKRTKKVGSR